MWLCLNIYVYLPHITNSMPNVQIPWVDMEKFWEVMRETSVVKMDLSMDKLEETKRKLIESDPVFENVELSWIKDFLDLWNSIAMSLKNYHEKYWFDNTKTIKEETKSQVREIPQNNKERHKLNRLRSFATLDEKVKRHIDHVANCKCWHMPRYVKKEIEKRMK